MPITNRYLIGNNLIHIRKSMHLTQAEAADIIGLSQRAYANIECGDSSMSIESLCKICSGLHITPNDLFIVEADLSLAEKEAIHKVIDECSNRELRLLQYILQILDVTKKH